MTIEELEQKISELTAEERYDLVYRALFSNNPGLEQQDKISGDLNHRMKAIYQEHRITSGFEKAQEMGIIATLRIVFNSQFGAHPPDKSGTPKFRRFLVFIGENNYGVGMRTYRGSYDTFEQAQRATEYGLANALFHSGYAIDQIFDSWLEKIVWDNGVEIK